LTFSIKGIVWRSNQQVLLLCLWAKYLMGCLYLCVVRHIVTGSRMLKDQKMVTSLQWHWQKNFQGSMEKYWKITKKTENSKKNEKSTIKPLSTISVSCMKIQEGHGPPLPTPMPLCLMAETTWQINELNCKLQNFFIKSWNISNLSGLILTN